MSTGIIGIRPAVVLPLLICALIVPYDEALADAPLASIRNENKRLRGQVNDLKDKVERYIDKIREWEEFGEGLESLSCPTE